MHQAETEKSTPADEPPRPSLRLCFFGSALNGSHREKQPVDCRAFTTTLHLQQADLTFAGVLRALRTGG